MKKNARSKNQREQTPKPRNAQWAKADMDLRQGSRTTPIPAGNVYRRKPKHGDWA